MSRWLVVGGGSAGCVVAARLSETGEHDVTLLEAGPDRATPPADRPPGAPVLDRPELLRGQLVVRRPDGSPQPYAQGQGLGGSSLINGGVVVGALAEARAGHDLPVEPVGRLGPVATALVAGRSDAAPVGIVGREGRHVSVADAYLTAVRDRDELTVVCDAEVDRLLLDGRRVVGAVTTDRREFTADRVVLCAGAIGTPTILLRSRVDTPGVGRGLQDHAAVSLAFDAPGGELGATIGATVEHGDTQIVPMERLPADPGTGALIAGTLRVASAGSVTLDASGAPIVELDQLSHPDDATRLRASVLLAIELGRGVLRDVVDELYVDAHGTPVTEIERDAERFRAWLHADLGGYHHLAGSCRAGVALDAHGALVGYDGISVVDASALPGVPPRNPFLTVVRHAETAARAMRAHR